MSDFWNRDTSITPAFKHTTPSNAFVRSVRSNQDADPIFT